MTDEKVRLFGLPSL